MPNPTLRFYTAEQLGPKQSLTPDGFLLCEDVPIARVGTMLYSQGEVPVTADRDGIIRIYREPEDVFAPTSIASWEGKPVCNDHPPERVSPQNWRNYAMGVVLNPRQGDGLIFDNDFLYCDLLVQDADAIRAIRQGKREVSAGYDAEYDEIAPGEGRQHLIVGNHVALVDRGRCGPKCMIGDEEMPAPRRASIGDGVYRALSIARRRARFAKDAVLVEELDKIEDMLGDVISGATREGGFAKVDAPVEGYGEGEPTRDFDAGGTHIHIHGGSAADDGPSAGPAAAVTASPEAGGGGGGGDQEILARLEALERAVAIIARELGGGDDDGDQPDDMGEETEPGSGEAEGGPSREMNGDRRRRARDARRRTGDDEPAAPPTDEPSDAESKENVALDRRRRATVGDSTSLQKDWVELLSRAEILAPGSKPAMTFDAARSATATFDAMCKFRRKVLNDAMAEDTTRAVVEGITGRKPDLSQMTCDAVSMLFNAASNHARSTNQTRMAPTRDGTMDFARANAGITQVVQSINAKNRDFYKVH